jgi:hypothetical protein
MNVVFALMMFAALIKQKIEMLWECTYELYILFIIVDIVDNDGLNVRNKCGKLMIVEKNCRKLNLLLTFLLPIQSPFYEF